MFPLYNLCIGRSYIERLLLTMNTSPALAPQALQLASKEAIKGRDISLYKAAYSTYERVYRENGDDGLPDPATLAPMDASWIESMTAKNQAERTKLEVELKNYSQNMIKESIRVRRISISPTTTIPERELAADGSPRSWRLLPCHRRSSLISQTLHQVSRVLYHEPSCPRDVYVGP